MYRQVLTDNYNALNKVFTLKFMNYGQDALSILKETSRTFYIPISRLPEGLAL